MKYTAISGLLVMLVSSPVFASTEETDNLVALIIKTNSKNLESRNLQAFANTIYCGELAKAQNDFDRQDVYQAVAEKLRALSKKTSTVISGLSRSFRFFPYNFEKGTIQINRGDYDWGRTAPLGSLLNKFNQPCWRNPGHMMGMPHIVEALPDWKAIPFVFNIPREEARTWFEGGDPTAELTFAIDVEKYTLEPMASPKVIFRGKTTEWELAIYSGSGKEVRRLQSKPSASAAIDTTHTGLSSGQSRIVTGSFNVREQPDINGTLLSTLGPNVVFDIEDASDNGEWTRINAVPIVRGWANTAVILRSSTPNAPDAGALQQHMTFLTTGIDGPPFVLKEEFHNAHNTHIKSTTHTYEPELTGPCELRLKYTSRAQHHGSKPQIDVDNWDAVYRFDFTKMTRIDAKYSDQPEEGIWHGFAGGHNNPRLRKPRKITILDYFGENAVCRLRERGDDTCTTADRSDGHRFFANPTKRPKDFQDAFKAIKAVCR